MSREERPSLFRGTELPRLILLAGFLVLGLPMAYYFGVVNVRPDPPKAPPIAKLASLPPPDAAAELADVKDISQSSASEYAAKAYLFDRVRSISDADLAKEARREVLPVDLLKNPARYRGLPIHLEGFAETVFAVDDIPPEVVPGGRIYEVWMKTLDHDQRMYPLALWLENAPATLPGGKDLSERVTFNGYFFKLLEYRAGDGKRFAPALIGRLSHAPEPEILKRTPGSSNWLFWLVPVVLVYVMGRLVFTFRKHRRPATRRNWFQERRTAPDPEVLGDWLQAPEIPADDPPADRSTGTNSLPPDREDPV